MAGTRHERAGEEAPGGGRRRRARRRRRRDAARGPTRQQHGAPAGAEPFVVGLLAGPGFTYELARDLARDLPDLLRRRFPGVAWRVELRREPMAAASDDDVDLIEIAHQRMLAEHWTLAVCLTDFPVHIGNRPVTAYASAAYGVGLVSVPALGPVNLDDRLRSAVVRLIEGLVGESVDDLSEARDRERQHRMLRRLEDLSTLAIGHPEVNEDRTIRFMAAVGLGNLRLLLGMVRANRPWRLVSGLSRAIVGALGVDIFGVASPGVWMIADGMGWVRLLIAGVASIAVICVSLVAAHRLWRRTYSDRPEGHARVVLFNLTTTITVGIGVLTLYLALFVLNLASALVLITTGVLERQIGHPAGVGTYLALAWLVTSLATLGGALGAALENDRAVREAAYGYRPDARNEALREQAESPDRGPPGLENAAS
ncbi:MAG: hypothetical protein QOH43_3097 [Solirubrobacteraceae bacterium]|nr:hypothetical protein [Solirubrobacteraceae bacterium]